VIGSLQWPDSGQGNERRRVCCLGMATKTTGQETGKTGCSHLQESSTFFK
jgi:hypothetical protein